MLFSPPIMLLRKCPLCPYATAKKFAVGDSDWLVQVLFIRFSGLTAFSLVLAAPRLLCFLQGELAAILRFRTKSEGLGKPAQ